MDLLWWLPAAVLAFGTLVLLRRMGRVEAEVRATSEAIAGITALATAGHHLRLTVDATGERRSTTAGALAVPAAAAREGGGRRRPGPDQ